MATKKPAKKTAKAVARGPKKKFVSNKPVAKAKAPKALKASGVSTETVELLKEIVPLFTTVKEFMPVIVNTMKTLLGVQKAALIDAFRQQCEATLAKGLPLNVHNFVGQYPDSCAVLGVTADDLQKVVVDEGWKVSQFINELGKAATTEAPIPTPPKTEKVKVEKTAQAAQQSLLEPLAKATAPVANTVQAPAATPAPAPDMGLNIL